MEDRPFSADDRSALDAFLRDQNAERNDGEGNVQEMALSPEKRARMRIAQEYIMRYFPKFSVENGSLEPFAQRMRITLPLWAGVTVLEIEHENGEREKRKLLEAYPDFGIGDMIAMTAYIKKTHEISASKIMPGTDEKRAHDYQARVWGVLSEISQMALHMDQEKGLDSRRNVED